MTITFRKETFRDDFTFRNSLTNIRRFPFPFDRDEYMYRSTWSRMSRQGRQRL
jgi:hypothetical protein